MHCRIALIALSALVATDVSAAEKERVMGWRGDGSGRYPDANPPLDWGRISKTVKGLAAQARRPQGDEAPGKEIAIPDGVLRKWLVLGPLAIPGSGNAEEALRNAETLSPNENEKAGDQTWQAVTAETSCLDFCAIFRVPSDTNGVVVFAHAYIYSPTGEPVAYNTMFPGQGSNRIWLNGSQVHYSGKNVDCVCTPLVLPLKMGWNRLLVMVSRAQKSERKGWWFSGSLFASKPNTELEGHGVAWATFTPTPGSSAPVIAGDRLFFTGESGTLFCANKADGKMLWSRSLTGYDFATAEERKEHPEEFRELDALAEQERLFDQSDVVMPWKPPALEKDWRFSVEAAIQRLMLKVSREKYSNPSTWGVNTDAGCTPCTPVTDGKFVFVCFETGIVACYDLDGNRKWQRLLKQKIVEHGRTASPLLVDNRLIVYFSNFTVLDPRTGATILERPIYPDPARTQFHGTGCVVPAGSEKVFFFPNEEFVRPADGKTLTFDDKLLPMFGPRYTITSPVVDNGVVYKIVEGGNNEGAVAFKLPAPSGDTIAPEIVRSVAFKTGKFPYYYEPFYCASPLLVDGLMYCINGFGTLTVVDTVRGDVAYQRRLDLDLYMPLGYLRGGVSASPTLAGKYIYIWGNQGSCIVMDPGRTFKQLAKLRIESPVRSYPYPARQEATISSPVFEGDRMYLRGEYTLYCIGPK